MRKLCILIAGVLGVGAAIFFGCKSEQSVATPGEAIVSGTVRDSSGAPLAGVTVQATSVSAGSPSVTTGADGTYSLTFSVDSTAVVTLTLTKGGYNTVSQIIQVTSGVATPLDFVLAPKTVIIPVGPGTGIAQTIAFLGANPEELRVYGVGGLETAILGYEVRDSLGFPIDAAHAVQITFSMSGNPSGGEYISPAQILTNSAGRAYTTFDAGVKAGVAQVIATCTSPTGKVITSSPVRVIIDAGFPDQDHFTISADAYNFAGMDWVGRTDNIGVQIGDKYSNPVTPGTAVYFHTSPYPATNGRIGGAGVITAAVYTDGAGHGFATLFSGNPKPLGAYAAPAPLGDAYHYAVARTVGEGGVVVTDSVLMMWSGLPLITNLNPPTFNILNGQEQDFTFTVADVRGHPLAAGTVITVTAQVPPPPDPNEPVNQVNVGFGINGSLTLPDVIFGGQQITNFSARLSDGTFSIDEPTPVTMIISVSGPNGSAVVFINGTVH